MSRETSQISRTQSREGASRGTGRAKPAKAKNEPLVKSVLIEPRDNEPPRVSVSVEYESDAPNLKALKRVAMEAIHEVVRREGRLEDLGYRHQQKSRELVQMFEVREKGEGGG